MKGGGNLIIGAAFYINGGGGGGGGRAAAPPPNAMVDPPLRYADSQYVRSNAQRTFRTFRISKKLKSCMWFLFAETISYSDLCFLRNTYEIMAVR